MRKQSFLFPRDSTWPPSDKGLWSVCYGVVWFGMVFEAYILTCFNKVCLTGIGGF